MRMSHFFQQKRHLRRTHTPGRGTSLSNNCPGARALPTGSIPPPSTPHRRPCPRIPFMPCTQSSLLLGSTAPDSPSCHPPTRQASPMTMFFYFLRASLSPRDTEFSELGGSFPVLPQLVLAGACWPGPWPHPLAPPPCHLHLAAPGNTGGLHSRPM